MITAVADTHAVIWYLADDPRLGVNARNAFSAAAHNGDEIAFSVITLVEIVYLVERNRISASHFSQLLCELDSASSVLVEEALSSAIVRTLTRIDALQVPDMPDRIIAATALHLGLPAISRDHRIQASSIETIW
jgi:PIN domain nuclease of toxin-antitoxin system